MYPVQICQELLTVESKTVVPQKAISSSAQPCTTIVSYCSSMNPQSPKSNHVPIWNWRRDKALFLFPNPSLPCNSLPNL